MLHKLTLAIILLCLAFNGNAQDKIYLRNFKVIEAKVLSVDRGTVTYKKFDNPDGPDYTIGKRMIRRIEYENGAVEKVLRGTNKTVGTKGEPRKTYTAADYGNTIISIAPIGNSWEGIDIGMAYEQMLDKNGKFSFFLPVHFSYAGYKKSNNDAEPIRTLDAFNQFQRIMLISPGVKFYPTGSKGKIRYAIGGQVNYQQGYFKIGGWSGYGRNPGVYTPPDDIHVRKIGLMLNNSVNTFPTPHIYIGADLGLGSTVFNSEEIPYSNEMFGSGPRALIQFCFRVGYRF